MKRRKQRNLHLVTPFPRDSLREAWKWHRNSKALTAALDEEEFVEYFSSLLNYSPSWGVEQNGELVGIVCIEPTCLPGRFKPNDGQVHIALARRAWGGEVIQCVAQTIIPAFFAMYPTALRLTAWTLETNHPARSVAESCGYTLEGKLRSTLGSGEALLLYGLTRQEVLNG